MGYRRQKVYVLEFEDAEFEGLEVRARGATVGGMLSLIDMAAKLDRGNVSASDVREIDTLFRALAGCPSDCIQVHPDLPEEHFTNRILSWNLEDEGGQPIEPSYKALLGQDFDFSSTLAMTWMDAVIGIPGELGKGSSSGGPSPEVSIPMESLSPGLEN